MSSASESRTYALDPKATGDALASAAKATGLREKSRTDNSVVLGEGFKLLSFSWPVTVTATLKPADGKTTVDYRASNFGFGPIQTGRCRKLIEKVTAALADREGR